MPGVVWGCAHRSSLSTISSSADSITPSWTRYEYPAVMSGLVRGTAAPWLGGAVPST